jgi:hypothetical protein
MLDEATAVDQLRTIRAMINDTRRSATDHWIYLFIWGGLGLIAAIASQLLQDTPHEAAVWLVWSVYWLVASVSSHLFGRRAERRAGARTFIGRIVSAAWDAVGNTIAALFTATLVGILPAVVLPGMIAWTIAGALWVMATALEFPMLSAAAVLWWAGGAYTLFRPQQTFVVFAVLIVLGYLVPAALLQRQVAADDALD